MSDLVIRTLLDDSGLTQQVKGLHKKFATAFRTVKAVAIPAAVIAGAAALAEKLSDVGAAAARTIAPLGDQAKALGLSAERFQELRILTEQQGGSVDLLDRSLETLNANLGKFATGAGKRAEDRLAAVGVNLRDSKGQVVGVAEAWDMLSAKISSGALSQEQAVGAATAAFGTQGAQLLEVLRTTREQQDVILRNARQLGAIIPEEAVRNAQQYADKLDLIERGTKALQDQRDLALAPLAVEWELVKNAIAQATVNWAEFLGVIDRGMGTVELELEIQRIDGLMAKQQRRIETTISGREAAQLRAGLENFKQERDRHQERLDMLRAEEAARTRRDAPAEVDQGPVLEEIEVSAQRIEVMRNLDQALAGIEAEGASRREAARIEELQRINEWNTDLQAAREAVAARDRELDEEETEREKSKAAARKAALADTISGFSDAFAMQSAHSKKAFKVSQALSIAQAVMSTHEAVVGALAAKELPVQLRIAMAAAMAVKGSAQVSAIKRLQFGGGTTPTMAGTPTVGGVPVMGGGSQTLRVEGISSSALFTGDGVRDLAQRLLDYQRDGGRVVLVE